MSDGSLYGEADLARLREERTARQGVYKRKMPVRAHARCVRCQKTIPPERRRDARYCSERCKVRHKWDRHDLIPHEIQRAVRAMKTVARCACGQALDTRVRPGPVPKQCRRCYMKNAQARYRARKKAEQGVVGRGVPPSAGLPALFAAREETG